MNTTRPAPLDMAAIDRELDHAVHQWRAIDERTATLAILRLAVATRDNHLDAAWLTLLWTDQPGTAHLVVGAVHDEHGDEIADSDDDSNDVAFNLTDSNQHVWQLLVANDPVRDSYRLPIAATIARLATDTGRTDR